MSCFLVPRLGGGGGGAVVGWGGSFWRSASALADSRTRLVSSESLSNHSGAVETAEVGTWSVGPRWERRRSERVREVRVLVDQSGDEPLLSSRCVSEERFSHGK